MRAHSVVAFCLPLCVYVGVGFELGCSAPKDNHGLFADESGSAAAPSLGGSSGVTAGTDSGSVASTGGISNAEAGSRTGGGSDGTAGSASVPAGGSSGSAGAAGVAGSAGGGQAKGVQSCGMVDGAVTNEVNGHCYRVNSDKLTFVDAGAACRAAAGHLVTLGDEAEDDFVHHLMTAVHWIGATDGRADRTSGAGTFMWTDGEPWDYTNWESGQPNGVATDCADESGGAHCYEHCAFQTEGGAWNDRACFHTIASVCEWEPLTE